MNGVHKYEVTSVDSQHFAATVMPRKVTTEPDGMYSTPLVAIVTHSIAKQLK
jgi:hypothetical protein